MEDLNILELMNPPAKKSQLSSISTINLNLIKMKNTRIKQAKETINRKQDYNRLEIQFQKQIEKDKTNIEIMKQVDSENLKSFYGMLNSLQSEKQQKMRKLEMVRKQESEMNSDDTQINFYKAKKSEVEHSEYLQRKVNETENELENQTQQQL